MKTPRLLQYLAYPQKITGPIIEAELRDVAIGELCEIRRGWHQKQVVARAQVVGLQRERTVLSLIGNAQGLSRDVVLYPTGRALSAWVGYSVLGAVLDPTGKIVERFTLKWRRLAKNALLMSHRRLTLHALASVNR